MEDCSVLKPEMQEELLSLSTPMLVDAKAVLGLPESHLDPGIRPTVPFTKMVGTALTVRIEAAPDAASADLTAYLQACESDSESCCRILVMQVPVELHSWGIFGEGSATLARCHGFVGALIDGAVRDTEELRAMGFPVFSRTISPGYIVGMATAVAPGEPLEVGGRTIHSGDVIVADNDGVIVLRPGELTPVVERARAIKEWEHRFHGMLAEGKGYEETAKLAGPMP